MSDKELILKYKTWIDEMKNKLVHYRKKQRDLEIEIERYETYVRELQEDLKWHMKI